MPRTETCPVCRGSGIVEDGLVTEVCGECVGNGYLTTPDNFESESIAMQESSLRRAIETLRERDETPILTPPAGIDLTSDTPVPGRMANQTWRILEEQRQAAEDTIRECEAEIDRWTAKLDDAVKSLRMAKAGRAILDGADHDQ